MYFTSRVTNFLKQFDSKNIEAMDICNLLTKTEECFSDISAVIATIWNSERSLVFGKFEY